METPGNNNNDNNNDKGFGNQMLSQMQPSESGQTTMPIPSKRKKLWLLIGVAVIVLAVLITGIMYLVNKTKISSYHKLPTNLPAVLNVDPNAVGSTFNQTDKGTTVVMSSTQKPKELLAATLAKMTAQGWTVVQQSSTDTTANALMHLEKTSGATASSTVGSWANISIQFDGKYSQVFVKY